MFCTVNSFFEAEGIDWSKVKAVYTDGAPSMLGRNSGFQALVKEVSPDASLTYFPDLDSTTFALVRNPFTADINQCVPDDEDAAQEELITLATDSGAKDLSQFWCGVMQSYPRICDIGLRRLIPFPTTYLCESAFSTMLTIKSKARNRLQLEPDIRCCLSSTQSRIARLVAEKQFQQSH